MVTKSEGSGEIRKGKGRHTASALAKAENVSNGEGYGPEETLVTVIKPALIKDLDLDLGRFEYGAVKAS